MHLRKTIYRFSDGSNEPCVYLTPIHGFDKKPLVSLEQAVEPLISIVPDILQKVGKAKERASRYSSQLPIDESAAIILYTMEWRPYTDSLYFKLNSRLRDENRACLIPWFSYLKLIFTGLARLPKVNSTVYRGIFLVNQDKYQLENTIIWWGFSSCSANRNISEQKNFFGQTSHRVLFVIECLNGVDISQHSCYRKEKEVLLLPGTNFQVKKIDRQTNNNICTVYLQEIESPHVYLEKISVTPIQETTTTTTTLSKSKSIDQKFYDDIKRIREHEHACLSRKNFTDNDMKMITEEIISMKRVRILFLRGKEMTLTGIEILAKSIEKNYTLEELYLTDIVLSNDAMEIFIKIISHSNLKRLCLNNNEISNQSAIVLANMLKSNRILTHLWLPKNRLSDQGINELFQALIHNQTLQILSLEWNLLQLDQTIQSLIDLLKRNQTLTEITTDQRDLSRADCKHLKIHAKNKSNFKLLFH